MAHRIVRLAGRITIADQVAGAVQANRLLPELDARHGQGWQGLEVEGLQCFAAGSCASVQMAAEDAAMVALGELYSPEREETGSRPALRYRRGLAISAQSLWKLGRGARFQTCWAACDCRSRGGHALAQRASNCPSEDGDRHILRQMLWLWPTANTGLGLRTRPAFEVFLPADAQFRLTRPVHGQ